MLFTAVPAAVRISSRVVFLLTAVLVAACAESPRLATTAAPPSTTTGTAPAPQASAPAAPAPAAPSAGTAATGAPAGGSVPLIKGSVGTTAPAPAITFDPGEDIALGENDQRLSGRQLAYARCQSYASIVASRDERYDRERTENAVFPSSTVFSTGNSLNASIVYREQLQRCLKQAGYGSGGSLFGF